MNSVSMYRNQVHWTRFIYTEIEFNELGFYRWKPSSLNSFLLLRISSNKLHCLELIWILSLKTIRVFKLPNTSPICRNCSIPWSNYTDLIKGFKVNKDWSYVLIRNPMVYSHKRDQSNQWMLEKKKKSKPDRNDN